MPATGVAVYEGMISRTRASRAPAPSAQTFIDQYAKLGSWSPHWDAATRASTDLWDGIQGQCPETPPGIFG
jgi:hypothetical protein